MTDDIWKYGDGDTFHLLLYSDAAVVVMEHWLEYDVPCDLRMRRSRKARGGCVLETDNVIFASWVVKHGLCGGLCVVRGGKVVVNKKFNQ